MLNRHWYVRATAWRLKVAQNYLYLIVDRTEMHNTKQSIEWMECIQ